MNKNNLLQLSVNPQPIPATYTDGFSQWETVTYLVNLVNTLITNQNLGADEIADLQTKKLELQKYLDEKTIEDKRLSDLESLKLSILNYQNDITNNRKLSANGDFTGTLNGLPMSFSNEGLATDINNAKGSFNTLTDRLNNTDLKINDIVPDKSSKMKGVSIYFKTNTDINNFDLNLITTMKNDGVTDIILCPILVCSDTSGYNSLSMNYTVATLQTLVNNIINNGLNCSVKFHLNMSDGSNIYSTRTPSNPSNLFSSLQSAILLTLTASQNFKLVCMANESPMLTQNYRTNWINLINAIRGQNPSIKVTNSPTFSDIQNDSCVFWDLCDYIGSNLYPVASYTPVPSVNELEKSLYIELSPKQYQYVSKLYYLSQKYNKPFIITEFGIMPYENQASSTSSWNGLGNYNETVQANYYNAMFEIFMNMENCAGLFVWDLSDNFTFVNKQAEQIVKQYYLEV